MEFILETSVHAKKLKNNIYILAVILGFMYLLGTTWKDKEFSNYLLGQVEENKNRFLFCAIGIPLIQNGLFH